MRSFNFLSNAIFDFILKVGKTDILLGALEHEQRHGHSCSANDGLGHLGDECSGALGCRVHGKRGLDLRRLGREDGCG